MKIIPTVGILAGEPEIIGQRCADGGKCHHGCKPDPGCFRKECCGPLALSGLSDNWLSPEDEKKLQVQKLRDEAHKLGYALVSIEQKPSR